MKKILFTIGICFLVVSKTYAADSSSGCGPAWYILKDNSLVSSALRITTNGILFPLVTLGMTLGTSNCTKHSIVKNEVESLYFANQNFFELMGNIAQGEGLYLNAFAKTIGCPQRSYNRFSSHVQRNYDKLFPDGTQNPERLLLGAYTVILSDKDLTQWCSLKSDIS